MIDSDTIIDKNAIAEFIKAFESDPKLGAVAGEIRVLNNKKNLLTKLQHTSYDYAFNISKRCESVFGTVMCCCGCLSGYRREAITDFIRLWNGEDEGGKKNTKRYSSATAKDNEKNNNNSIHKQGDLPLTKRTRSIAMYDDCEDSALTVYSLLKWSTKYVSSAIGYTEVPESIRSYFRQQVRWTKGSLRTQIFASHFMWRRSKKMALIFYSGFANIVIAPLLSTLVFIMGISSDHYWILIGLTIGGMLFGFLYGIDSKIRYPKSDYWKYSIISYFTSAFIITLTLVPAAINYRKNAWLTR
jgi:hyaluronan synthase